MKKCIMNKNISTHWLVGVMVIGAIVTGCGNKHAESKNDTNVIELLNVSYDPTREFYTAYNELFRSYWKEKSGQEVKITQSHGGSGSQAPICRLFSSSRASV